MVTERTVTTTTITNTSSEVPLGTQLMPETLQSAATVGNYASFIGVPLHQVEQVIRSGFSGSTIIYAPGQTDTPTPGSLKIFVDERNIITRIVTE